MSSISLYSPSLPPSLSLSPPSIPPSLSLPRSMVWQQRRVEVQRGNKQFFIFVILLSKDSSSQRINAPFGRDR